MVPLLRGTKVLELGSVVMGPYASQILADLGADVVKVEPCEGDIARAAHPGVRGMGALFVNNNRNKRVIAIDLKTRDGYQLVRRLIQRSDVLLHNLRINAAERLGVGFAAARAINPRLIYCSATGFGRGGRYRDRPAFDDVVQAASGLAALLADSDGAPRFVPSIIADKVTALHAVYGILAALCARNSGRAEAVHVEVPMFETVSAFLLNEHLSGATFDAHGHVGYERVLSTYRRPYRTADGWIAVLPYTLDQWRRFLGEVGRQDVVEEPWFMDAAARQSRLDMLYRLIAAVMPSRDTDSWLAALTRLDIPASRVNRLEDLLNDPHLADVGFFDVGAHYPSDIVRKVPQPVSFDGVETGEDAAPRALGADTYDVLIEYGCSHDDIVRLAQQGVVRIARPDA